MTDAPAYDATVRHAVYVERYKSRIASEIASLVNGVSSDLYATISASDLDQLTQRQLNRLLRDVERLINKGYGPIQDLVNTAAKDFASYEAEWQAGMLNRIGITSNLGIPSNADLWAAVNARPFEGKILADWVAGLPAGTLNRIEGAVRQGYVDGIGPLELARQIRGTPARKGIMNMSRHGAQTMARTALAHTAAMATQETFRKNRRIKEVQWVSVLDHRTSQICRTRDGTIYPKNDGPRPPAHPGCRSTVIPVTSGNKDRLEDRETYKDWFARQSATVQDDILGPSRGKLYREGDYTVDRFSDESGQLFTLDQLRDKDRDTFNEVFGE